MIRGQDRTFFN